MRYYTDAEENFITKNRQLIDDKKCKYDVI